jgi:hypothetical protein
MSFRKYIRLASILAVTSVLATHGLSTAKTNAFDPLIIYNVASGQDIVASNGSCSLTEAVENINTGGFGVVHTDCPESGDYNYQHQINLPSGEITLTQDLPNIQYPTSIIGQGRTSSTINGDNIQKGIVVVDAGSRNEPMEFKEFTIKNFASDGYLAGTGTLLVNSLSSPSITVEDVTFEDYGDTGFASTCQVTVNGCSITIKDVSTDGVLVTPQDIGAGISTGVLIVNPRNLEVDRYSTSNNTIGMYVYGSDQSNGAQAFLDVKNATFHKNAVGIFASSRGGSIGYGSNQELSLTNNTIYGNYGAGLLFEAYSVDENDALDVKLENNIIAGNKLEYTESGQPVFTNCDSQGSPEGTGSLTVESLGGNLSESEPDCLDSISTANGDEIFSDVDTMTDPQVTELSKTFGVYGNYGGAVSSLPITDASPAKDAGNLVEDLMLDARGLPRLVGPAVDIGAFELGVNEPVDPDPEPPTSTPVDNPPIPNPPAITPPPSPNSPKSGVMATLLVLSLAMLVALGVLIVKKITSQDLNLSEK